MTFSILGFCPETGQRGIAYTTVTLAGGGISPCYGYAGDIVVVQAYGNQKPAFAALRALDAGASEADTIAAMQAADENFEFRQVGVVTHDGRCIGLTGDRARPWAGHHVGEDFVAMGNVLVGPRVVDDMASAFMDSAGMPLAERLLRAIEAGRDAGGQQAPDNCRYDERSALLKVIGDGAGRQEVTAVDLRVDMQSDAVSTLRSMYTVYKPVIKRRSERATDPGADLPTSVWEAENMTENPPPPALKPV